MTRVLRVSLCFFALLASLDLTAKGATIEVQAGQSYMDRYPAHAAFVEGIFGAHRIGASKWRWSPDVSMGWVAGRSLARYATARPTSRDDVWLLGGGARLQYGESDDWYRHLFFSFQPAVTHGKTQALSSGYEFVSSLGWQGRHVSFQIRHISNGGLHEPNRGETMALLGVGFQL